jgi:hypothetical protein
MVPLQDQVLDLPAGCDCTRRAFLLRRGSPDPAVGKNETKSQFRRVELNSDQFGRSRGKQGKKQETLAFARLAVGIFEIVALRHIQQNVVNRFVRPRAAVCGDHGG